MIKSIGWRIALTATAAAGFISVAGAISAASGPGALPGGHPDLRAGFGSHP